LPTSHQQALLIHPLQRVSPILIIICVVVIIARTLIAADTAHGIVVTVPVRILSPALHRALHVHQLLLTPRSRIQPHVAHWNSYDESACLPESPSMFVHRIISWCPVSDDTETKRTLYRAIIIEIEEPSFGQIPWQQITELQWSCLECFQTHGLPFEQVQNFTPTPRGVFS
jgi:hypothetical protein